MDLWLRKSNSVDLRGVPTGWWEGLVEKTSRCEITCVYAAVKKSSYCKVKIVYFTVLSCNSIKRSQVTMGTKVAQSHLSCWTDSASSWCIPGSQQLNFQHISLLTGWGQGSENPMKSDKWILCTDSPSQRKFIDYHGNKYRG